MNNSISVSVGILAYNEESNIKKHLLLLFRQRQEGYSLKEIIVLSDGSTDKTVELVKELRNPKIRILDYKKRMGKSYHLNTIFRLVESEILVLFDADVILKGNSVISNLIRPLIREKNVGIVSGDFQPLKEKNFLQKAIKSTINVYEIIRHEWRRGHNVLGSTGRIMALKKSLYKSLKVPPTMVLNDIYLYFASVAKGFQFRHIRSATALYQLPNNLKDYISQQKRFVVGKKRMFNIFGKLYESEYAIPKKRFYELMFRQFLQTPIHCLFIYFLNSIITRLASREIQTMDGKWEMVVSTKTLNI